ncbi:MAG: DUF4301 family protein [Bacteroidaceae bacterium]|nr:DUF4301 family protein [Bacteroidaceae bacterium]
MFTEQDYQDFEKRGIDLSKINSQIESLAKGFPYLQLSAAAAAGKGIYIPEKDKHDYYIETWQSYCAKNHTVTKFVPASGAASRMFKDLFGFLNAEYDTPQTDFEKKFFANIRHFAFFNLLNKTCIRLYGKDADALINQGKYKSVVEALLNKEGLNYGALPKGLLQFHNYDNCTRTPLEEHLVEGALYASSHNEANLHFTVSAEHKELFKQLIKDNISGIENKFGIKYNISFSEQKASTDTIAVDLNNNPFRNDDGSILFRPGGHGALIENLNQINSDIVFIKNIDNVVPDRLKSDTVEYKKLLAGVLVSVQEKLFSYLKKLENDESSIELQNEILMFMESVLNIQINNAKQLKPSALYQLIKAKLNRPIRVCGMVRNVGEPGGGPFLAYGPDGTIQLQILESSQIDMDNCQSAEMFKNGTHFNPVDLVCGLKDYKGNKFDLTQFIDPATGFISRKSKSGRELKALELPGLWNGAMSNWNTIFVEVPLSTFNPVKTVNDLLREQHQ